MVKKENKRYQTGAYIPYPVPAYPGKEKTLPRPRASESGQTLVEFILVCLPLFALIFLALQLCLLWSAETMTQVAAYSAARKFAVCGQQDAALQDAMLYLPFAKASDVTLNIGANPGQGVLGPPSGMPASGQWQLHDTFYVQLAVNYYVIPAPIVEQFFLDRFPQSTTEGPFWVGPQADAPNSQSVGVQPPDSISITSQVVNQQGYTSYNVTLYNNIWTDPMWPAKNQYYGEYDIANVTLNEPPTVALAAAACGCWDPNNTFFITGSHLGDDKRANYIQVRTNSQTAVPTLYDFYYVINHWSVTTKMDGKVTLYAGSVMTYESNGD